MVQVPRQALAGLAAVVLAVVTPQALLVQKTQVAVVGVLVARLPHMLAVTADQAWSLFVTQSRRMLWLTLHN